MVGAAVRLSAIPPELLVAALGVAMVLVAVQSARLALLRWLPRRRIEAARAAGADGEARAEPLLRELGYAIVARQAPTTYELSVDGEPCAVALRADFLVERDGRRFVAEVKTGRAAPRVETPATRRQLLEYRVAFDVDGVLLVDVDAGRVHALGFPAPPPPVAEAGLAWLLWLALGAALGFGAAEAWRVAQGRGPPSPSSPKSSSASAWLYSNARPASATTRSAVAASKGSRSSLARKSSRNAAGSATCGKLRNASPSLVGSLSTRCATLPAMSPPETSAMYRT